MSPSRLTGLQVYTRSAQLRVGASAIYTTDGDEVESVFYVEDDDVLHPEFVEQLTATLLYKGKHDLGSATFDNTHGSADGSIVCMWARPAHNSDLSVRFRGTVQDLGDVDFTVPVSIVEDSEDDIPLSENMLPGVDIAAPGEEPSGFATQVQHVAPSPEETVVPESAIKPIIFKLNMLSQYGFLEDGVGPVSYTGGGNRLLSKFTDPSAYVLQAKNVLPASIGAHTRIEDAETNLLANSDFLAPTSATNRIPLGYAVTAASTVTVLPTVAHDQSSGIGLLHLRAIGSGAYVGPKKLTFSYTQAVAAAAGSPMTLSVLAKTAMGNAEVVVKDLRLVISARSASDTELSRQEALFDPSTLQGTSLVLLQNAIQALPTGTTAVRVSLELESIEASDDIILTLAAPLLATNPVATSRVVGATAVSRAADVLRIPQQSNIEFRRGTIGIIFAPDYEDHPTAQACLFDSRDADGMNGFAMYHLPTGQLRFVTAGPVSAKTLDTNLPVLFQTGIYQEVSVSWASNLMRIAVNNSVVASDDTLVVLPQSYPDWLYIMQSTTGTDRLEGELASFEIRRTVKP
jgi:hypothetical protein